MVSAIFRNNLSILWKRCIGDLSFKYLLATRFRHRWQHLQSQTLSYYLISNRLVGYITTRTSDLNTLPSGKEFNTVIKMNKRVSACMVSVHILSSYMMASLANYTRNNHFTNASYNLINLSSKCHLVLIWLQGILYSHVTEEISCGLISPKEKIFAFFFYCSRDISFKV